MESSDKQQQKKIVHSTVEAGRTQTAQSHIKLPAIGQKTSPNQDLWVLLAPNTKVSLKGRWKQQIQEADTRILQSYHYIRERASQLSCQEYEWTV